MTEDTSCFMTNTVANGVIFTLLKLVLKSRANDFIHGKIHVNISEMT